MIRFEEDTLRQRGLWIRLIIEFLGTFVLVTVAADTVLLLTDEDDFDSIASAELAGSAEGPGVPARGQAAQPRCGRALHLRRNLFGAGLTWHDGFVMPSPSVSVRSM